MVWAEKFVDTFLNRAREINMYNFKIFRDSILLLIIPLLFLFSSVSFADKTVTKGSIVETTKVADGVYVFRWWVYRNIFIVTNEGVIATDPINPKAAKMLMKEIRKVTDKPIKYVVYSHNHWDHISGGNIFKEAGAKFISHENCKKHFNRRPNSEVVVPDITFSDKYMLTLGGKELELQYFGENHGDCAITMRLPEEKIIFIVDLVTPKRLPYRTMPDFLPDEWIRSLSEIEALDFDTVIAGHGPHSEPVTSPRIVVQEQREYLEALLIAVKTQWDKGIHSPDKLREIIKLPRYEKWRGYEAWLPMNIERIWEYYHMGR